MHFIPLAVWIVGLWMSFSYGRRLFPLICLILGAIALAADYFGGHRFEAMAALAIISIALIIRNRIDALDN